MQVSGAAVGLTIGIVATGEDVVDVAGVVTGGKTGGDVATGGMAVVGVSILSGVGVVTGTGGIAYAQSRVFGITI